MSLDAEVTVPAVLLVSDGGVYALGFEALLFEAAGLDFLGVVGDRVSCMGALETRRPDVIVVDDELEGATRLCAEITNARPTIPILILASTRDDDAVWEAINAGARGYIDKRSGAEYLRLAITWLAEGLAVLDPHVTRRVISWATAGEVGAAGEELSDREIEVLRYVIRGEPNKCIARALGVTENTVKTYLRRAYRKLDCHTRSAAAAAAVLKGIA